MGVGKRSAPSLRDALSASLSAGRKVGTVCSSLTVDGAHDQEDYAATTTNTHEDRKTSTCSEP